MKRIDLSVEQLVVRLYLKAKSANEQLAHEESALDKANPGTLGELAAKDEVNRWKDEVAKSEAAFYGVADVIGVSVAVDIVKDNANGKGVAA